MSTSTSRIWIQAPAERVWETVTRPELVKQWQYGSDLLTDWSVGSQIRFRSEWGDQVYEQWGTVLEYAPVQSLSYSLFAPRPGLEDKPEHYFTMRYELQEDGDGVRLSIIQHDTRPGSDPDAAETTEAEDDGTSVMSLLKRLAESSNGQINAG